MTLKTLDTRSLAKLAQKAGLSIDESDIQQLAKRRIISTDDDEFVVAHLFVLALYEDAVRVTRHPWGPKTGEVTLDDVRDANKRLNEVLRGENADEAAEFALELERYLAQLDPFGPLTNVVDMLGDEAGEAFRGAGRLYVELRRTAKAVAIMAEGVEDDSPHTIQVPPAEEDDDPRATADLSQAEVLAALHAKSDPDEELEVAEPAEEDDSESEEDEILELEEESGDDVPPPLEEESEADEEAEESEADEEAEESEADEEAEASEADEEAEESEADEEAEESEADEEAEASEADEEAEVSEADEEAEVSESDEEAEVSEADEEAEVSEADEEAGEDEVQHDELTAVGIEAYPPPSTARAQIEEEGDDVPAALDADEFSETTEMDAAARDQDGPATREDLPDSVNDRDTPQVPLDAVSKDGNGSLRDRLSRLRNTAADSEQSDASTDESDGDVERKETPPNSIPAVSPTAGPPGPPPTRPQPHQQPAATKASPEEIAAKVDELNQLRERYIADHNWEGLAELYEDRITLFETPAERQQIYLTLATVYDVKLKRPEQAMTSYAAAINEGADAGMKRALDGLNKVGKRDGNRAAYLEWLETAVSADSLVDKRTLLRQRLASVLGQDGHHQRAFMTMAALATEHPADVISPQSLDQLDEWASQADLEDELDVLFDDVIEEEMPDETRRLVAQRAGLHHVAKNQSLRAIRFFRAVLQIQPDNEMAYGNLSRLYADEENWSDLVRLIESKIRATDDEDERERLHNQLADAVESELATDEAIDVYTESVDAHPDNAIYADRLVRAHLQRGQHAEAYGLLNRFVDTAVNDEQRLNIHLRLAEIAANHLQAPEEALVHYEDAMQVSADPRALMGLAQLRYDASNWPAVVSAIDQLMEHNDDLHFEERIAWLEKGIDAAERAGDDDAMQRFISGMNQFDV